MNRRTFLQLGSTGLLGAAMSACSNEPPPGRYTQADIALLTAQQRAERQLSGTGPHGRQVYAGYRGLSELPWFDLDESGRLRCTDESIPYAIDIHSHLGISTLFAPDIDLQARPTRLRHLLDCDASTPGCELNLDVYANSNFTEQMLQDLERSTLAQGLWGSPFSATQTIPALLDEMDAMRVEKSVVLPIKLGFPFGDDLTERWRRGIEDAGADKRLVAGLSVHPRGRNRLEEMRAHAATGARVMKLHPTVQSFYPDDPIMAPVYEEAQRLGLIVFFHGGRAGIEPPSRMRYALPRHYEAVLAGFPKLQVIIGHAGARDMTNMVPMAQQYENAWLDIHGQGVTALDEIIAATGGERLLFGSDWTFYHIGMTLAKVLICTEAPSTRPMRQRILRDNAIALLGLN
ncbi:MAG: amidohydrolase family protein [Pseudomonadota bacterium]